jgi:hypothetical protein
VRIQPVVHAAEEDRPVRVPLQEAHEHLPADARDRARSTRVVLQRGDPVRAGVVLGLEPVPGEMHLHPAPLVRVDVLPGRPRDEAGDGALRSRNRRVRLRAHRPRRGEGLEPDLEATAPTRVVVGDDSDHVGVGVDAVRHVEQRHFQPRTQPPGERLAREPVPAARERLRQQLRLPLRGPHGRARGRVLVPLRPFPVVERHLCLPDDIDARVLEVEVAHGDLARAQRSSIPQVVHGVLVVIQACALPRREHLRGRLVGRRRVPQNEGVVVREDVVDPLVFQQARHEREVALGLLHRVRPDRVARREPLLDRDPDPRAHLRHDGRDVLVAEDALIVPVVQPAEARLQHELDPHAGDRRGRREAPRLRHHERHRPHVVVPAQHESRVAAGDGLRVQRVLPGDGEGDLEAPHLGAPFAAADAVHLVALSADLDPVEEGILSFHGSDHPLWTMMPVTASSSAPSSCKDVASMRICSGSSTTTLAPQRSSMEV